MKSNLPPEDKRMHKFPKAASGEREKQNSCHFTTPFVRMIKVEKITYRLRISECTSLQKYVASAEREKQNSCHSPHFVLE